MCIGYHLFDVAFDKVFGHVDWYCPVVSFRVVSFDWGYRGHDVVTGVWAEVCDRVVTYVACSLCHMIFSLVNCIWIVFSFFPDKSVPV